MDRKAFVAGLAFLLAAGACGRTKTRMITVGSKNFTEQVVLGEIVAQHIEKRLGVPVLRRLNLGGTLLTHQALITDSVDVYPEYTGTAITAILKEQPMKSPDAVFTRVKSQYADLWKIEWLPPLGFDNPFAMVVRGADARKHHMRTLTDARDSGVRWRLGVGYEFLARPDGMAALNREYDLKYDSGPKTMDLGLLYKALEQDQVNMIAANQTDGLLSTRDLKVLADDKGAFPPYQACLAANTMAYSRVPGLRAALLELSGKISTETMRKLNQQVDGEHRPVREVAAEWLKSLPPERAGQ